MGRICKHCHKEFDLAPKVFSNHVRWCPENKTRDDATYTEKLRQCQSNRCNALYGEIKEHKLNCIKCGKEYVVTCRDSTLNTKQIRRTCSDACGKSHSRSEESRENIRNIINERNNRIHMEKYGVEINYNTRICAHCGIEFEIDYPSQRRTKYCTDFCRRQYKRKDMSELKRYRSDCQFTFSLKNFPDEFDFSLIDQYGWYKAKNHGDNPNGVSRDHMISVVYGFKNNISPSIISHPANCKLMRHNENVSKGKNASITLYELLERIKIWDEKYSSSIAF